MLHVLIYGGVAVGAAVVLFFLATWLLPAGEQIAPPLRDEPLWSLPEGRALEAEDVDSVRLPVAVRGYRFAETDQLLDRLAAELRHRDAEIARLRGYATAPVQLDKPAFVVESARPVRLPRDEPAAVGEPVRADEPMLADEPAADLPDDGI